jgi:hypothetical protein
MLCGETEPCDIAAADLNGDELPDLAVANCYTPHDVSILINLGNGTFAPPVSHASSCFWRYYIESGDLDNEGDIDLAVANGGGSKTVTVLLNDGVGAFSTVNNYTLATEANAHSLSLGDLDGDAYLDIVTANSDHDTVTVLRSDGDGCINLQDLAQLPSVYGTICWEP